MVDRIPVVGSTGVSANAPTGFANPVPGSAPSNIYTFATLPPGGAPGNSIYTSDQGICVWNGFTWSPIGSGGSVSSSDGTISVTGSNVSASPLNILPGTYSYAGLPAAGSNVNKFATTTDKGAVFSNGAFWQILYNPTQGSIAVSTNTPLPTAQNATPYSLQLTVSGATGGITWSRVDGFTYTNVWAVSSTGLLTGTPTVNTIDTLAIQVSDATGAVAQRLVTLQTLAALTPAATPTFSPVAGNYVGSQSVTISDSTPSSTIFYTTNGSTPTTGSTVYTTPITVSVNTTVKAIATAAGFTQSAVGSAAYTFGAVVNTLGINFAAGGSGQLSYEGFPIFQDMFRCGRYINNVTGSIASTGVLTVTATQNSANSIPIGGRIINLGGSMFCYILAQLSGTTGSTGTYQTSLTGVTVGSGTVNIFGYPNITMDANGWPTTDFTYLLWEGHQTLSWMTAGGNGKLSCGFLSKNAGAETIAAVSNCTVTDTGTAGGIHTFDLAFTSGTSPVQFSVTGTTGGVTNIFCRLPAYRAGGYVPYTTAGSMQFTTDAIAHYNQYAHIRPTELFDAWENTGYFIPFTTNVAAGSTSAILGVPFPFSTAARNCLFANGFSTNTLDLRAITLTNGGTSISWTGVTTQVSYGIFIPNSSVNRSTPSNFKCYQGAGQTDNFPAEWMIDLCFQCSNTPYLNLPINDDGTYATAIGTLMNGTYSAMKAHYEIGNEVWGGSGAREVYVSQVASAVTNPGGLTSQQYLAVLYHNLATTMKTAYGGNFAANCWIWLAGQTGSSGVDNMFQTLTYYAAQGWSILTDLKGLRNAPYYNLTNASITGTVTSGVMSAVSGFSGKNIAAGSTVTGTSVPANTTITSQLTVVGQPGFVGTYQLSNNFTVGSETLTIAMPLASTIAQIQTNLAIVAPREPNIDLLENMAALAFSYGIRFGTYEGGWQVNNESPSLTNGGAAELDTGFTAIENSYKQVVYNAGCTNYTAMESGVSASGGNLAPTDELTNSYPPTVANSPKFASHVAFSGTVTPTKNVVNGVGAVIQGYNYLDNLNTTLLGNFNIGGVNGGLSQQPLEQNGWASYIINVTAAGSYNIDVTFSGVSASPTTNLRVDATTVAGPITISGNGVLRVASAVSLSSGSHLLMLGKNGSQTAFITQIQFN